MTNNNCLLGQLLVDWQLATKEEIENSVRESQLRDVPLGLTLIIRDAIESEVLHSAIAAQSFLRDQLITDDLATHAMLLVKKKRVPFGLAMDLLRVEPAVRPRNRLGDLLIESETIDRKTIKSRLALSKATGVNLGRVLSMFGDVTNDLIKTALDLQKKIRAEEVDRDEAIDGLYSQRRCRDVIARVSRESLENQSKLGQLMTQSGIATHKDIVFAMCVSKEQGLPLGEALVAMNCATPQEINAALEIQNLIRLEKISVNNGIERLKRMSGSALALDAGTTGEKQNNKTEISFHSFLKLLEVIPQVFESNAWSPEYSQNRRILDMQLEETWQELTLALLPPKSSPILPDDVRDMLCRNGFLTDSQQMTAQRAAFVYKLLRERRASIDQALVQFRCLESFNADPGSWTGTFPALPTIEPS